MPTDSRAMHVQHQLSISAMLSSEHHFSFNGGGKEAFYLYSNWNRFFFPITTFSENWLVRQHGGQNQLTSSKTKLSLSILYANMARVKLRPY